MTSAPRGSVTRSGIRVLLLGFAVGSCNPPAPAPPTAPPLEPAAPQSAAHAPGIDPALVAAVERDPTDPAARRRLAIALHEGRQYEAALAHFEKLVELSPERRHLLDLALVYKSLSRIPEAVATYERILAIAPEDPVTLHNLGNVALERGDADGAIALYSRAIRARPDYLLAHYHLGSALARVERFAEAYRSFERVLQLEPANGEDLLAADDALYRLASIDLSMGAYERAAAFLAEAIAANPAHPRAHHAYGQALMQVGRREEALREFDIHMRLLAAQEPTAPVASGD